MDVRPLLERFGQRRLGDARRNRIDADAKAANLRRKALDQEADRRLGAAVDREARLDVTARTEEQAICFPRLAQS